MSTLLGNHNRRAMDVAAGNGWHDGRIDNTQALHAMHLQVRIHYGHGVHPHLAGTCGVVNGFNPVSEKSLQLFVGRYVWPRKFLAAKVRLHAWLCQNFPANPDTFDQRRPLLLSSQLVGFNSGWGEWIAVSEQHSAPALWPQMANVQN